MTELTERPTDKIRRLQVGSQLRVPEVPAFVYRCPECDVLVEPMKSGIALFCTFCQMAVGIESEVDYGTR